MPNKPEGRNVTQRVMIECALRSTLVGGASDMVICDRLRALREEKKLSQLGIEKRDLVHLGSL